MGLSRPILAPGVGVFCLGLACLGLVGASAPTRAEDEPDRAARWQQLENTIFPHRTLEDARGVITIDAPPRALDAALVPIELRMKADRSLKGVYLIIDDNPAPLAAHFTFGPMADPSSLKLRVRVNQYTDMHAVMETRDGKLFVATTFVKAAGGCSAPAGADDAAALADLGRMKLRLLGEFSAGKPLQAQLMIRHPNFNGMQMNQISRLYTPARFIRSIDASYAGARIFHVDSDISLSTDPAITFGFVPRAKGELKVVAEDSSQTVFDHTFEVPAAAAGAEPKG